MILSIKTKAKILLIHNNYLIVLSLILVSIFIISNYDFFELRSAYYLKTESKTTKGIITKKWVSSGENDPLRMAYDFSFYLENQGEFSGTSYSKFDKFNSGDTVYIDYIPWGPSYGRIQRFEVIEKSTTTLWISGFIFLSSLTLLLFSFFDRLLLVKELRNGQIVKIDFSFVESPDWLIKRYNSLEDDWDLNDLLRKYTFSYQLTGEKKQTFSFIGIVKEKYKSKDQFGLIRKRKRPRLLTLLPETLRNSILNQ